MNDIAYCGLACCVCSENETCKGCQSGGCDSHGWCKNYNCCREKGLEGCWACSRFPCRGGMLDKPRIRAFAQFAKQHGAEELSRCLKRNKANGIRYHYDGQLVGDYDLCGSEEEMIEMLRSGTVPAQLHYDLPIRENNDPVYDKPPLQEYMNKWDGAPFIELMELSQDKNVLEIGCGTGRLAVRVAPLCGSFTGIDISPETIKCAERNLSDCKNVSLVRGDFLTHPFRNRFHIIYSSLTFMHIAAKQKAIVKIADLLERDGRFVLSIDKKQSGYMEMNGRRVKLYPDTPNDIENYMEAVHLTSVKRYETEFAYLLAADKIESERKYAVTSALC